MDGLYIIDGNGSTEVPEYPLRKCSCESECWLVLDAAGDEVRMSTGRALRWDEYTARVVVAPSRCDCGSEAAGCGPGAHSSWCSMAVAS
jgi:hypothetical protein